jgi:oxygen-dependent protoporphyrinogen oxidase
VVTHDAPHVVVVGAGITGLTAAFTLVTRDPDVRVTVLEGSERVGGKVLTTPFAGHPVDCGADAFLARVPDVIQLCDELGIARMLTSPAERSALVWSHGSLRELPSGLVLGVPTDLDALAASGIVSPDGVARAARDLERTEWPEGPPGSDPEGVHDQSVGTLVRTRLGDEVFERLVSPLLSGVNAGDADQLSLAAGAAQLASAARRRPSLIAALREQQRAALAAGADPAAPVFHGIPVGSQTLTDLLLGRLATAGAPVHLRCPASALEPVTGGWRLRTPAGAVDADRVVLAMPGPVTARLLESAVPDVAAEIGDLQYASVAMVTLAVPRSAVDHPLDASGFLVAPADRLPFLAACSFASTKWAHLADPELAILRVSAGRYRQPPPHHNTHHHHHQPPPPQHPTTIGLAAPPVASRVTRWIDALPQYRPGHLSRVRDWRARLSAQAPGVVLAGAAYDGLGLPACVRQGRDAAQAALADPGVGARP